ncbi:MAG: tetratricopeptide repeat protein [Flavobacteriales bacterium]
MKKIHIIVITLLSFSGISQTPYEKGMQKALDLWNTNKPDDAINLFERIAVAEPEQWLPKFYVSYITVIQNFNEKEETKLMAQQEKAMNFLNQVKEITSNNEEVLLLEALWYTVWVAYDGATYGMKYGGKVSQLYQDALQINPNNPRVILNKAQWDIGGAKFFGQPLEPYCKDIQHAIDLSKDYKPKGKFYPIFELDRAKELLKTNCN